MPKYIPTNEDLELDYTIDKDECTFCGKPIPNFDHFCSDRCAKAQDEYDDFMSQELYYIDDIWRE